MARRISDDDSNFGGEDDTRFIGDPSGQGFDLGAPSFGTGDAFEKPPAAMDQLEQMLGGGGGDTSHDVGNTERGRDLRPDDTMTTTARPDPGDMGLPQGVSVNDALAAAPDAPATFGGGATMDTPAMPTAPAPVAAQTPNPGYAQVGTQVPTTPTVGTGPRRRSVAPQMFGESKSPMLFGRAGGLMGGGLGATGGGEASGAIAPTQMMKKLLQLFQQQ